MMGVRFPPPALLYIPELMYIPELFGSCPLLVIQIYEVDGGSLPSATTELWQLIPYFQAAWLLKFYSYH